MNCSICNKPISDERLKTLPDTKTCIGCSPVQKKASVEIATGKHCEVQFVDPEVAKEVEERQRSFLGYGG